MAFDGIAPPAMVTWRALQVKGTAVSNVVDQDRVVAFDVHLHAHPKAPACGHAIRVAQSPV